MLNSTNMNSDEEKSLLDSFKNLYPDFPQGHVIHDDAPDFTVTNNEYVIGIELTEIFQDLDQNKCSKLKENESLHNKIGNHLAQKLREFTDFDFHVTIGFESSFRVKKKIDELIRELLIACAPELHQLKEKRHFQISNYKILPEGIQTVGLWYSPKFTYTTYLDAEGGMVSNFTDRHLSRIIEEKEKAIKKYKPCTEQWLLIKEGNFYAGSLDEIEVKNEITTSFDSIFLYRVNRKEIIKLK